MKDYIEEIYWIFWVDKLNKDLEKDLECVLENIFSHWAYAYRNENATTIKQLCVEIAERTDDDIIRDSAASISSYFDGDE